MSQEYSKAIQMFGERVAELRTKRGLSLRDLESECNLDHSNISKIEKGKINPSLITILELSKGLGVHPKKLFEIEFE